MTATLPTYARIQNALAEIDKSINGSETCGDNRTVTIGALLDVTLEHAKSIWWLLERDLYSSALALIRPMFETFVRALWARYLASDDDIQYFLSKDQLPRKSAGKHFNDLVNNVSCKWHQPADLLPEIKRKLWKSLNSYTHGGTLQLSKRFNGERIGPHSTDALKEELYFLVAFHLYYGYNELLSIVHLAPQEKQNRFETVEQLLSPIFTSETDTHSPAPNPQ